DLALGNIHGLRQPDSIIIDRVGYKFFFPGEPLELGKTLEINDRLVQVAGVANSSAPFQNLPVFYTRYSQAITYVGRERNLMSFVLVKPRTGVSAAEVRTRVEAAHQLKGINTDHFGWDAIWYYIRNTGIPVNFGLTVAIALVVGTVVAGQTFYIFTIENLKQFGALKAIGVTNRRIMAMILLQAMVVGVIGYCLGMAMTATFFEVTKDNLDLRGFRLPWEIMAGTGVVVLVIVTLASLISIR